MALPFVEIMFTPNIKRCPAEPGFISFENTVDPDQLASSEAS